MAVAINQEEVIRWMDDVLHQHPGIRQSAERVIKGMWTFAERMKSRQFTATQKPVSVVDALSV